MIGHSVQVRVYYSCTLICTQLQPWFLKRPCLLISVNTYQPKNSALPDLLIDITFLLLAASVFRNSYQLRWEILIKVFWEKNDVV